jgi:hypothetical protein
MSNVQLGLLEFSHVPHVFATLKAYEKHYVAYSYVLGFTIILSAINHLPFSSASGYLNKIENLTTYATMIYTIVEFHPYIRWGDILIAILASGLYLISFKDYFSESKFKYYVPLHTLWHLITGLLLYSIISRAKNKNEKKISY